VKISLISGIYNRAQLLRYSLEALTQQKGMQDLEVEYHVGDEGSDDGLDDLLQDTSEQYGWTIFRYDMRSLNQTFRRSHNCPAAKYNLLVALSDGDIVVKFDPEFCFLTKTFIWDSLGLLDRAPNCMVMPLPHHTYEFPLVSVEQIRQDYADHEYTTHISGDTARHNNVYYGCMFSRKAFLDLGGIDVRFMEGIGSEDDHLLDQWRRRYGPDSVHTLLEEHGVHLWHGEWGKSVPAHLAGWVDKNAALRKSLSGTYPNNGDFWSIKYPEVAFDMWEGGNRVIHNGRVGIEVETI
jgi:hypothetical protein